MINYSEEQRKEVGQRFKEFRENLKITQREMGRRLNMIQSSITAVETGKSLPTIPVIMFLHENHGLSITWLLSGKGSMYQEPEPKANTQANRTTPDFGVYQQEMEVMYECLEKVPLVREFLLEQFIIFHFKNKQRIYEYLENATGTAKEIKGV
jgi:transcriptional regulator with XRE-family HTH domain